MNLSLVENGWDSLSYGLTYYESFLKLEDKYSNNNPSHLKMAIIMIHNACELFLKSYLSSINDLLIYNLNDKENKNELLSFYSKSLKDRENNLEYYLLNEKNKVKTIDYSDLVKVFNSIFPLKPKYLWGLNTIGVYRNMVTHYGINLKNEYYRVLLSIGAALGFIFEKLYKFIKTEKSTQLYNLYDNIYIQSEEHLVEEWINSNRDNFSNITSYIDDIINTPTNQNYYNQNKIEFKWNKNVNDDGFNEIHIHCGKLSKTIYTIPSPFLNVTFFADDLDPDGPIYFILDHSESKSKKDLIIFKNSKR